MTALLGLLLSLLLGLGLPNAASAQDVQPVPALSGRVIDTTATLSSADAVALENRLAAFEQQAGTQLVVLIIASTAPEDIASYAQRVAESWKIGRREVGDGLLVVLAMQDRKTRIEVAKSLEGAVPDLAARLILQDVLRPALRAGDVAGGLNATIDRLSERIRGEALPLPEPAAQRGERGLQLEELAMFFFVAVPIVGALATGIFGRKLGTLATSGIVGGAGWWFTQSLIAAGVAGAVALVVVGIVGFGSRARRGGRSSGLSLPHVGGWNGGGGWSGGGGSWGSDGGGGGFSSGGGGDFGGGGASGDW
jgi:uncharacterized protein